MPASFCWRLLSGKGECDLRGGEPNYSMPEISTEHQELLVLWQDKCFCLSNLYAGKYGWNKPCSQDCSQLGRAQFQKRSLNDLTTILTLPACSSGLSTQVFFFPGCCCFLLVSDATQQPHRFLWLSAETSGKDPDLPHQLHELRLALCRVRTQPCEG